MRMAADSVGHNQARSIPLTPGLVTEYTQTGRWLFRKRGYLPLLLLGYLLVHTALSPVVTGGAERTPLWLGLGLILGGIGLAVRALAAGFVPSGTSGRSTREMRADTLNTTEAYSLVRHPLYLGNFVLWLGAAAFVGKPAVLVVVALLFWVYYARIMIAEEYFLHCSFGEQFARWSDQTPAFFPSLRSYWRSSGYPFSLRYALGRDYPAIYAFVGTTFAIQCVRLWAQDVPTRVSLLLPAYILTGTAIYLVLRTLKRRTRLLEAPRRQGWKVSNPSPVTKQRPSGLLRRRRPRFYHPGGPVSCRRLPQSPPPFVPSCAAPS